MQEEVETRDEDQSEERLTLAQAKKERQEAEAQAKLLSNRIALLKQEEAKAVKKIEDTRQRAREIMEARIRNQEAQRRKEEERRAREQEEALKLESNRLTKEESKQTKESHRALMLQKLKEEVETVKRDKARNQQAIEALRQDVMETNVEKVQVLRDQVQAAKSRREEEAEEKRRAIRAETERRVSEELRIKREKEEEVTRMEQEELELIHRLQNTQMMHKSAIEELETLISTTGEGRRMESARATPSKKVSKPSTPSKS